MIYNNSALRFASLTTLTALVTLQHFALGAIAGGVGAWFVYPVDTVKTRMQVRTDLIWSSSWKAAIQMSQDSSCDERHGPTFINNATNAFNATNTNDTTFLRLTTLTALKHTKSILIPKRALFATPYARRRTRGLYQENRPCTKIPWIAPASCS